MKPGKSYAEWPKALIELQHLEDRLGRENLSASFYLRPDEPALRMTYSQDPRFVGAFVDFAQATGGGSSYALWCAQQQASAECPVVVFGDEGGIFVIARNVDELLRLLSLGPEISVMNDSAYFHQSDREPDRPNEQDAYVDWLKQRGLQPVTTNDQANAITVAARAKWQGPLDQFLATFGIKNGV